MSAPRKARDYDVGYARPPAEHRFQRGRSGNPSGRPKGSARGAPNVDLRRAFSNAANQSVEITMDGRRVRMSRMEAMLHQLATQGVKGNTRAAALFMKEFRAVHDVPEPTMSHEDWLDRLDALEKGPSNDTPQIEVPDEPE